MKKITRKEFLEDYYRSFEAEYLEDGKDPDDLCDYEDEWLAERGMEIED